MCIMNYRPSADQLGKCPKCGYNQICPCTHCDKSRNRKGEETLHKPWVWMEDGENVKCSGCGLIAHIDFWENWDMECYQLRDRKNDK